MIFLLVGGIVAHQIGELKVLAADAFDVTQLVEMHLAQVKYLIVLLDPPVEREAV